MNAYILSLSGSNHHSNLSGSDLDQHLADFQVWWMILREVWDKSQVPDWLWGNTDIDWQKVADIAVAKRDLCRYVVKGLRLRFDDRVGQAEALRREKTPRLASVRWLQPGNGSGATGAGAPWCWRRRQRKRRAGRFLAPVKTTATAPARTPRTPERALQTAVARERERARRFTRDDTPGRLLDWCRYGF